MMRKKRLLKVAAMLDNMPESLFNMSQWADRLIYDYEEVDPDCGTVFCACGYAAQKELIRGFTLTYDNDEFSLNYITKKGKLYKGWDAVQKAFKLQAGVASYLFTGQQGDTPATVGERIRRVVAETTDWPTLQEK